VDADFRYFLVTLLYDGKDGPSYVNTTIVSTLFPNPVEMQEVSGISDRPFVVLDIFEFKNKEDFQSFQSTDRKCIKVDQ
jgi:hypothetical protein